MTLASGQSMDDIGTWKALLGGPGIEHAYATVTDASPEAAMELAMARAQQKYGRQDWGRWRVRAEWCSEPVELRTVRFSWSGGALRRL
jgi:hypothetical protein